MRANAFAQLSNRLGAPVEFVRDRLPAPLQLATLNFLLAAAPQPLSAQLRLRDNEVSALVSDRYAALDAAEFVDTLRQALSQQGLLSSVRARAVATGTTDLIRLVVPSESQAIKVGDVTAVGLDLSTSSFGVQRCMSGSFLCSKVHQWPKVRRRHGSILHIAMWVNRRGCAMASAMPFQLPQCMLGVSWACGKRPRASS